MGVPEKGEGIVNRAVTASVMGFVLAIVGVALGADAEQAKAPSSAAWTQCGWGGGGFFQNAAYHPSRDGVVYLSGDTAGVYRTEDHGLHWRIITNGLTCYSVFSLAVDRMSPDTVYAATPEGLHKSTDAGEKWQLLPHTGPNELRITGERDNNGCSIRCVAVDPTNSSIVYAGNPLGQLYRSLDGGQTWEQVWEKRPPAEERGSVRVQFGNVTEEFFAGIWLPLNPPKGTTSSDCLGIGFSFKGDGALPDEARLYLTFGDTDLRYPSKNLNALFEDAQWNDVVLDAEDFALDPEYTDLHPSEAKALPVHPDLSKVTRVDFSLTGPMKQQSYVARFRRFFFALKQAPDGTTGTAEEPVLWTARDFIRDKVIQSYGNIRLGDLVDRRGGKIYSVAVAAKQPSLVLAATEEAGIIQSLDGGQSWRELKTPTKASSVAVDPSDPKIIYASFFADGVWKSTDQGQTWVRLPHSLLKTLDVFEVAISPSNPLDVYAIGVPKEGGWIGRFLFSHDGGETWQRASSVKVDSLSGNPTLPEGPFSIGAEAINITIDPTDPQELLISGQWRAMLSKDGGLNWVERSRGADLSCIQDIRFFGGKAYVGAMDEGLLVSADDGQNWRQLIPLEYDAVLSGHYARIAVNETNGVERIITTCLPWSGAPNLVVLSQDGGETFMSTKAGLPDYLPHANVMWETGWPRALAVDPEDSEVAYLGIDGDPEGGKMGGGVFKSVDGGKTWRQLPTQPGSRRMYNALAVDPTDSRRLFWGACGEGGGLYRSEDGGDSWKYVFGKETWVFNVLVTRDGTVYCPGNNLWRSTDHGNTWGQMTSLDGGSITGLEVDPRDSRTIWISNGAGVYRSRDGGATWQDITNPMTRGASILRFNPAANELWAGGSSLWKIKQ
jgi:photosystem II stability/assembly factor-like uncharacterized protein